MFSFEMKGKLARTLSEIPAWLCFLVTLIYHYESVSAYTSIFAALWLSATFNRGFVLPVLRIKSCSDMPVLLVLLGTVVNAFLGCAAAKAALEIDYHPVTLIWYYKVCAG
jgi:hypothetical protein